MNNGTEGRLEVNINKYNNGISISLHVNGKDFPFKHTKIEIYKQKRGSDDSELVFQNYEPTDVEPHFIGE